MSDTLELHAPGATREEVDSFMASLGYRKARKTLRHPTTGRFVEVPDELGDESARVQAAVTGEGPPAGFTVGHDLEVSAESDEDETEGDAAMAYTEKSRLDRGEVTLARLRTFYSGSTTLAKAERMSGEQLQETLGEQGYPTRALDEQAAANESIRAKQHDVLDDPIPSVQAGEAQVALRGVRDSEASSPADAEALSTAREKNELDAALKTAKRALKTAEDNGANPAQIMNLQFDLARARLAKATAERLSDRARLQQVLDGTAPVVEMPPGVGDLAPQITRLEKAVRVESDPVRKAQFQQQLARDRLMMLYRSRGIAA